MEINKSIICEYVVNHTKDYIHELYVDDIDQIKQIIKVSVVIGNRIDRHYLKIDIRFNTYLNYIRNRKLIKIKERINERKKYLNG